MNHEGEDRFDEDNSHRALVLQNLYDTGNKDEVIRQGRRFLEQDPTDSVTHYYLCLVAIDQKKFEQAQYHLEQIRERDPNAWEGFHAALHLSFGRTRFRQMSREAESALEHFPEEAEFHYLASIAAARRFRLKEAKAHIRKARELEPNHAGITNLDLTLRGTEEDRADQAWDRIHEYEEALAHDPENVGLLEGLGDVYLDDLDDHENAERCYRQALLLNPSDRDLQRTLFRAVAKRRLFYRFLSIPSRAWSWLRNLCVGLRVEPWRILFLLLFIKGWLIFLLWLACMTCFLWPPCIFYEWMVVSQLRDSGARDTEVRLWTRFHRLPAWLRFGMFTALMVGFWSGLLHLLNLDPQDGLVTIACLGAVHWFFTALLFYGRKMRSSQGRRKAAKRRRQAHEPPPLPSAN